MLQICFNSADQGLTQSDETAQLISDLERIYYKVRDEVCSIPEGLNVSLGFGSFAEACPADAIDGIIEGRGCIADLVTYVF